MNRKQKTNNRTVNSLHEKTYASMFHFFHNFSYFTGLRRPNRARRIDHRLHDLMLPLVAYYVANGRCLAGQAS